MVAPHFFNKPEMPTMPLGTEIEIGDNDRDRKMLEMEDYDERLDNQKGKPTVYEYPVHVSGTHLQMPTIAAGEFGGAMARAT